MARAAAKFCLAALALRGAAASLDAEALFQKEVRSHTEEKSDQAVFQSIVSEQLPGLPGLPSIPGLGGAPAPAGAGGAPAMPQLPQPSMEDIMKIMSQVVTALRNETVVTAILESIEDVNSLTANATRDMTERYAAFNASVHQVALEDVIPVAVTFMEAEMDTLRPQMHNFMKSMVKLIRKLPLGKKGREAKLMIAMAEPMLLQGLDDQLKPLKDSIEAMGNKSTRAFCEGALPIVVNASATVAPLRTAEVELKKAMQQLPMLRTSPMALMMPDVVPTVIKLGQKILDGNQRMIENIEAQAIQLNTTFRWALNERLDCDILIQSGAAPRGLGVLAALASLAAAWLML